MHLRAAIEDMEPEHWVAWMLDLSGCYSSGRTEGEALARAPRRITSWLSRHDGALPTLDGPYEVVIVERFETFPCAADPDYLVNAFFENDRRPLGYADIALALRLLDWNREELGLAT